MTESRIRVSGLRFCIKQPHSPTSIPAHQNRLAMARR